MVSLRARADGAWRCCGGAQAEEPISTIVLLAQHLETSRFQDFWLLTQSCKDLLAGGEAAGRAGGRARAADKTRSTRAHLQSQPGQAASSARCGSPTALTPSAVQRRPLQSGAADQAGPATWCCRWALRLVPAPPVLTPPPALLAVPGFYEAVRAFILHNLAITFYRLPKAQASWRPASWSLCGAVVNTRSRNRI